MLKVRKGSAQNPVTRKEAAAKIKPMGGLGHLALGVLRFHLNMSFLPYELSYTE